MRTKAGFETTEEVEPTDHGVMSARLSKMSDNKVWVRINQYVTPFHTFSRLKSMTQNRRQYRVQPFINGHIFVPMDDENTMTYNWIGRFAGETLSDARSRKHERSKGRDKGN